MGPARYDPHLTQTKRQNPDVPSFANSHTKRKVFEPTIEIDNTVPDLRNPGPAHYDTRTILTKSNQTKSYSYIFNSQVTKEVKLPVTGLPLSSSLDSTSKSNKISASSEQSQAYKPFMSSTARNMSYIAKSGNPGPALYFKKDIV